MKIEVGKEYEVIDGARIGLDKGDIVEVSFLEGNLVYFRKKGCTTDHQWNELTFKQCLKEIMEPTSSKPAHYDTAIDTIAFAKANFSREQVEGFMRINAIKYLQRDKGQKLSDLRKCAAYVQMLIELEEEK